jgi:uncharacterized repeat protein (TIGR01451 family)
MNGNLFSGRKNFLSAISVHILVLAVISMVLLITPMAANAETGDVCIDHYQPGAVCTANDVRVVSFTPHPGTFSGCTNGIGTATFDVKVSAIGSPDRYDIGLFFSQDGTSAKTGTSCDHDFLSGVLSTTRPSIDTDADGFPDSTGTVTNPYWNGDGDSCGDVSTNSNAYRTVTLTFACVDLNGDNLIDIPVCTSWDNQASGGCTDVTGAFPGTKSKCDCQVVPSGLPISLPAITVVKSPANQAVVSGNNAAFTITVANTGTNAPLHNIIVSDPQCTTLTGPVGDTNSDGILQDTETWNYTCTVNNVTSAFTNTVTATGTPPSGPDVTATATANVTVNTPLITVVKTPSFQAVASGGTATFTITVTNPGSIPLTNITVTDPQCTTLTGPVGDTNTDSILQTTETWVYTCTTTNVTAGFINNVTASGTVADGPTVTDSDSAQVTITAPPAPMITVIKTPSNQAVVSGGTATFTLTVRNPGSVPLHNIIVSDPQCTTLTGPAGDTNTDSILQTTETWVYTCTVNNVTSAFTNTVTATGTPPSGPDVFRSATAEVAVVAPTPPTQVPTMTEWGMILFMLLAGLGSVYYLRKRKRV